LYKQHYELSSGQCLEDDFSVANWPVKIQGDDVKMAL